MRIFKICFIVALSILLLPTFAFASDAQNNDVVEKQLSFEQNIAASDFFKKIDSQDINLSGVKTVINIGTHDFKHFTRVEQSKSFNEIVNLIYKTQKDFIERALDSCKENSLSELENKFNTKLKTFNQAPEDFILIGATVSGSKESINDFVNNLSGIEFKVITSKSVSQDTKKDDMQSVSIQSSGTWKASTGDVRTGENLQGNRYMNMMMWWDNPSFDDVSRPVYEHQLVTYNYDNEHYFTDEKTTFGYPDVESWTTDLPGNTYLDTAFDDDEEELVYGVGTLDPEDIQPNEWYWIDIVTEPGNASTDKGKLEGQLGYQVYVGGQWTVKILGLERYIDAWDYSIPGYMAW